MSVIYVCGPMSATGRDDHNYPAFNAAETGLRAMGYDVLNPADIEVHNTTGEHQSWQWYMRYAIRMVSVSDGIALLPGWGHSKGAIIEYQIGAGLKLDIRRLSEWLDWSP